ncbi:MULTISPECIES: hypothetical protein [Pseudomonas]|uniref:Acyl-CoA dehydrogenase n=1 Tax=Pseudomonas asplenii TaxID=53407 RepID=A0A0N0VIQ5_9PSED|nr:hypothetical protein [Pseudomonas fuscovaginae]KPA87876.1 hypothetical protein PF66_05453 [Pseudomonas fuscovaginae]KPA99004.1 hypothetical protein PF70_00841 [Pseudomonas fuscovaginae]
MNALNQAIPRDAALNHAGADLQAARSGLERTLAAVRGHASQARDPQVISQFGDLQIRIEVATALIERAQRFADGPQDEAEKLIAATEAAIASAEALQQVGNTEWALTGQRAVVSPSHDPLQDPLHLKYKLIGNFRLNGVLPDRSRSAVDVP